MEDGFVIPVIGTTSNGRKNAMKEHRLSRKLAKLQFKAETNHSRARYYTAKNKHKIAGKFEGRAKHIEMKIHKTTDKLQVYSVKLGRKEEIFRMKGKMRKADKLNARIVKIHLILKEYIHAPVQTLPQDQIIKEIHKEKEIIKEIVRTPCMYCGAYIDHTELKCPNCGGNLQF